LQFVPDTLHVLLRVSDYLIDDLIERGLENNAGHAAEERWMQRFVDEMHKLNVKFAFWRPQTEGGGEGKAAADGRGQ